MEQRNTDTNLLPKKQKVIPHIKKTIEDEPRLGQGRGEIRHRKYQLTENITASTNKSHEIPKMPTAQNVVKNRTDFPACVQSVSSKTEAITRGTIQDKNRVTLLSRPNL